MDSLRNPVQMADSISKFLHELSNSVDIPENSTINLTKIYIASPPSELEILLQAREELRIIAPKLKIVLQSDVSLILDFVN